MPKGIYTHKTNQGFQKGHKSKLGQFKNGMPYKETEKGKNDLVVARKNYRDRIRKETLDMLGGKCIQCGFADYRALQVDHINGGGHAERKLQGYDVNIVFRNVRDNRDKYQLLCANCNVIKRIINKEHGK